MCLPDRSGAAGDRERRAELHREPCPAASEAREHRQSDEGEKAAAHVLAAHPKRRTVARLHPARARLRARRTRRRAPARHARAGGSGRCAGDASCSRHSSPSVSVPHPGWPQTLNMAIPGTYGSDGPPGTSGSGFDRQTCGNSEISAAATGGENVGPGPASGRDPRSSPRSARPTRPARTPRARRRSCASRRTRAK